MMGIRLASMHRGTRAADGFTIVEMLVAMILILIAGAMVSRFLVEGFAASNHSKTELKAAERTNHVMDLMENDFRGARSPDRDPSVLGDVDRLRRALNSWSTRPTNPQTGALIDPRDIVYADGYQVQIRTDAIPGNNNAIECVVYYVANGGADNGWLMREVRTYSNVLANACGGTARNETAPVLALGGGQIAREALLPPSNMSGLPLVNS